MAVTDRQSKDAFAPQDAGDAGPPAPHEQVPCSESDGTVGPSATA